MHDLIGAVGAWIMAGVFLGTLLLLLWRGERMMMRTLEMRSRYSRDDEKIEYMLRQAIDSIESMRSLQANIEDRRTNEPESLRMTAKRLERSSALVETLTEEVRAGVEGQRAAMTEWLRLPAHHVSDDPERLFTIYKQVAVEYSHAIKTPLASIAVALKNLSQRLPQVIASPDGGISDTGKTLISLLSNATLSLDTIHSILRLGAGFLPGDMERFSVSALAQRAVRMTFESTGISPSVAIRHEDMPDVMFHQVNVLIALVQLLENAFEAAGTSGEVAVSLSYDKDAEMIGISVRNSGSPIPAVERAAIFEQGVSTKGDGRGGGLSLAKHVMESAGGRVLLDSSDKTGTEFIINFRPNAVFF